MFIAWTFLFSFTKANQIELNEYIRIKSTGYPRRTIKLNKHRHIKLNGLKIFHKYIYLTEQMKKTYTKNKY